MSSNNLGLDPAVLAAANAALTEFVTKTPSFYNTSANCKALQNYLKSQGIPIEQWGAVQIFAAAFWACGQADAQFPLETAPAPKTQDEINREKEARDRAPGLAGRRIGEKQPLTPGQTRREQIQEEERKAKAAQLKANAEADYAAKAGKIALQADMSLVPTVAQILASHTEGSEDFGLYPFAEDLSSTAANSWGAKQLALYFRHSAAAKITIAEQRNARIRAKQRGY